MFYKDDRLALFIDGSSLYLGSKSLGFEVDYRLLRQEFARRGKLIRIMYYTTPIENAEYSPVRALIDWLSYNGYHMVSNAIKDPSDNIERKAVKGLTDVSLTVDALELAKRLDHAVVFSGSGALTALVVSLQRQGVRVTVVATLRGQHAMVSDELRRQADNFVELHELRDVIGRSLGVRHREETDGKEANESTIANKIIGEMA